MEHTIEQIIPFDISLDSKYGRAISANTLGPWLQNWIPPLPDQYLGIEIEVEHILEPKRISEQVNSSFYKLTQDGSLRNNGIEIITKPLQAKHIETLLYRLYQALPKTAAFSPRTSIHVHINVRDLTYQQITNIIYTYIATERLLYNWVGANRHKSIFCVPIQDTDLPITLANFLKSKRTDHLAWYKYTGMNLLPISTLGTIEFRQLYGTQEPGLILQWISILQNIFQYSINTPTTEVTNTILAINTTSAYMEFLETIFKENTHLLIDSNFAKNIEKGISYLKTYVFPNDFLSHLRDISTKSSTLAKRLFIHKQLSLKPETTGLINPLRGRVNTDTPRIWDDRVLFQEVTIRPTPTTAEFIAQQHMPPLVIKRTKAPPVPHTLETGTTRWDEVTQREDI